MKVRRSKVLAGVVLGLHAGCTEATPGYTDDGVTSSTSIAEATGSEGSLSNSGSTASSSATTFDAATATLGETSLEGPGSSGSGEELSSAEGDASVSESTTEANEGTSGEASSSESTGPDVVLVPECMVPAWLTGPVDRLLDLDSSELGGFVIVQVGGDTLQVRIADDGSAADEARVISRGIEVGALDLTFFEERPYIVYELAGSSSEDGARVWLSEDLTLDPNGDVCIDAWMGSPVANARMPRIVAANSSGADELFVGFLSDTNTVRFWRWGIDESEEQGLAQQVWSPGSAAMRLGDWIWVPSDHAAEPEAQVWGVVEDASSATVKFAASNAARGFQGLGQLGVRFLEASTGVIVVDLEETTDALRMGPFRGNTEPVLDAVTYVENGPCRELRVAQLGDDLTATALCGDAETPNIQAVLFGVAADAPVAQTPVLPGGDAILEHRVFSHADQFWAVWADDAGLWIAPVCAPADALSDSGWQRPPWGFASTGWFGPGAESGEDSRGR